MLFRVFPPLLLLCCADKSVSQDDGSHTDEQSNDTQDIPGDNDSGPDDDSDSDTESPVDTESDTDTDTDTDTAEPPTSVSQVVRFVALGDGGEGNSTQYQVADAMLGICDSKTDALADGCMFALYLGDNFYDEGVDGVDDTQFQTSFEEPYAELSFPFYVVLGNHDYGGCIFGECGAGWEFEKSDAQVAYTAESDKWTMPDEYYTFTEQHVQLFGLDTNAIMWDPAMETAGDQPDWLDQALSKSTATWKIAYGHHPYISNGQHGNAGEYEGLDWLEDLDWLGDLTEVPIGTAVKDFMDTHVCGSIDLYICGHDHNRQWLEASCGTDFVVSGAAAKTTDLEGRGNPTFFEDDQSAGFFWVEIVDETLTGEFYDADGNLEYTQTITKSQQ